jgi:integrase
LSVYGEHRGASIAEKSAQARLGAEIDRLSDFWGDKRVSYVCEKTCGDYVAWRTAQADRRAKANGRTIKISTAKRELVTLSAALNWCARNKDNNAKPILNRAAPAVHMPAIAERRDRWLDRRDVARLLWGALGWNVKTGKRDRTRINRHIARFILIYFYTGTRHTAILRLQWMANVNGGWIDFKSGIINRRPEDAIETNKRRTPCPIPDRLLPHLLRWRRLTARYVIEFEGNPVTGKLRRAWNTARELAGFGPDITPHVLKHSCATVLLRAGKSTRQVAAVLGTSEQVIENTYGHHAMDEKAATFNDVWSRPRKITSKRG